MSGDRLHRTCSPRGRVAFTLVELLVVIAILGVIVAILMPSLNSTRKQAKRISCASNLKQIGLGLHSYFTDYDDHLPYVSFMPSISPWPVKVGQPGSFQSGPSVPADDNENENGDGDEDKSIYLADVLLPHVGESREVFECPEDVPGRTQRPEPNEDKSYFESERSSYEFRWSMVDVVADRVGARYESFVNRRRPDNPVRVANNAVWIMRDYDNFHAPAGETGSRRYLYVDGHVTDYEN